MAGRLPSLGRSRNCVYEAPDEESEIEDYADNLVRVDRPDHAPHCDHQGGPRRAGVRPELRPPVMGQSVWEGGRADEGGGLENCHQLPAARGRTKAVILRTTWHPRPEGVRTIKHSNVANGMG